MFRLLCSMLLMACCVAVAVGQQRPLRTEDVDVLKPGVIRIESGFEFLQDQRFPLSGLRGDITRIADTRLSFGMASNVEFQIEWTIQNRLSISERDPSAIPLSVGTNDSSTHDVGDAKLWMKMKLRNESRHLPSLGFRFGVELPNTNESRGIGTNTTNFFATINPGKKFLDEKLNLFGNIGIGILQSPLRQFTQNDVLMYGLAGICRVSGRVNVMAEANGFHSTRKHPPIGTEDFSEARLGAQVRALGVRWHVAGIAGLSHNAPKTGVVAGITIDWNAFKPAK